VRGRRSGTLAAWANAWLAGRCGTSDITAAVEHSEPGPPDASHTFLGLPDGGNALSDVLAAWRRSGDAARVVLPVAGDVRGLGDPAAFRVAALEAGEAVIGGGLAIVPRVESFAPSSAPTTVQWHAYEIEPTTADFVQLTEAQYELTTAIRETASALAAADIAGSRDDDVSAALRDARRIGEHLRLPPGYPAPAIALLAQAERMQAVVDLALSDDIGGAIDRAGIDARSEGLRPLVVAVRRARLAAYNVTAHDTASA
jgi:hypothetical protein